MTTDRAVRALRARTVEIPDPGPLERFLGGDEAVAWIRRGEGMIGLGVAAQAQPNDPAEADLRWREYLTRIDHETELPAVTGTGPIAFGSFAFDPSHTAAASHFVVPELVVGRRQGVSWITTIGDREPALPPARVPPRRTRGATLDSDPDEERTWMATVSQAVERIESDGLSKVVLARAVDAWSDQPVDPGALVSWLVEQYPGCWTYSLAGLVGASPEMLVRRERGLATSRVLAGTIQRSGSEETDLKLAAALSRSSKNLVEHELAVASVALALAPFCSAMHVPESPYVLELPNVLHLATDVTGVASDDSSALAMVARLHPSAAVCGTPTELARSTIAELEGIDRGRYSGPVGWIDSAGDGEWAIALRCGCIDDEEPRRIRLFAGCGIVAGSDPVAELAETKAKLRPMLDALGVSGRGSLGMTAEL